jgi:hypothetical protein
MTSRTVGRWVAGGLAVATVLAMTLVAAPAQAGDRWLHVRVVERGDKGESVKVNLPIAVLETLANAIEDEHFKDGKVSLGGDGIDAEHLRQMWQAVRDSKDMEFVTVESDDETVRVAKSGRYMLVKVDGKGHGDEAEKVDVKVPLDVVDALLNAPDGRLNVKAALQALAAHEDGALVQVHDGSSDVHVWIDSKAEAEI